MRLSTLVWLLLWTLPPVALAGAPKAKTVTVKVHVDSQNAGYDGARALDGNPNTMWHTAFGSVEPRPPHEITIDLGKAYPVKGIGYLPREGGSNGTIKDYELYIGNDPKKLGKPLMKGAFPKGDKETVIDLLEAINGRYVKLRALSEVNGRPWTSIAELRILSDGVVFRAKSATSDRRRGGGRVPALDANWAKLDEAERQFVTLQRDLARKSHVNRFAAQTYHPASLIAESDRDPADIVLRRTAALIADLETMDGVSDLTPLEAELKTLVDSDVPVDDKDARKALYTKACALRRKVAFKNPLLDFDKLLYITRHRPTFNHMCDQYYGINSVPGGSIYVLSDPFGEKPTVRDVVADSVVQRGRLKGQKLENGCFVSPDLSYDGKQIAFAWVECVGTKAHHRHTDATKGHWDPGRCYHVFKVNVDGTGLEQLTDGTWNDFDPCWAPNGRIVMISERRGGYLRCGRTCPTYTLYDMNPDGSDIRCLSPHETNEWHPSITHDGRIIYTRWDYVDRHGCTAHLPWITTLDGRDSRAVHGNFAPRQSRPDMELDTRAIPGSHKYVCTAAPHHGQAYGSLVVVDPRTPDDDGMEPVKRVTPEVDFPESQGGGQVYGTPWPLSEKYFLAVYDPTMNPGVGRQGGRNVRGDYGIYLVDCFGNKDLIHRDPDVGALSPIPLRPRPMPHLPPEQVAEVKRDENATSTIAVINTYDSLLPWPEGTKIKSLRVIQILPMSVPSGGPPHEIGLRLPQGRDSVILARYVLGTVPVEEDGSAHFVVPAMRELFFQALDKDGLAIQSMRSSTYLQKGERLVCQGCHEPKSASPRAPATPPVALRRAPSVPKPDVDGSNPFSYPRLVQPVLDRNCVPCHTKNAKKAPNLGREPIQRKWYASYNSLAPKYGFWDYGGRSWGDPRWYRTTPGQFGARASKLYQMLQKGHNDVKLSDEDMHRIALWLDCCSIFYGVYEKEGGLAQLEGKVVRPTLE
jgi:hypothetical protein